MIATRNYKKNGEAERWEKWKERNDVKKIKRKENKWWQGKIAKNNEMEEREEKRRLLGEIEKKIRNKKRWERGEKFNGRNEQVKI